MYSHCIWLDWTVQYPVAERSRHVWIYEIIQLQRLSSQWTSWPFHPHFSARPFRAHSFIWNKMFECQRVLMESSRVKLYFIWKAVTLLWVFDQVLPFCLQQKIIKLCILNPASLPLRLMGLVISGFCSWLQWVHQTQNIKVYYPFLTLI